MNESLQVKLVAWAATVQRFNSARLFLVGWIGGVVGLALSIPAGTFSVWLFFSILSVVVWIAVRLRAHEGAARWKIQHWGAVVIVPFFNQIAFVSVELYCALLLGMLIGVLIPSALRLAAWMLRSAEGRS